LPRRADALEEIPSLMLLRLNDATINLPDSLPALTANSAICKTDPFQQAFCKNLYCGEQRLHTQCYFSLKKNCLAQSETMVTFRCSCHEIIHRERALR
jgi:hypothetical protein